MVKLARWVHFQFNFSPKSKIDSKSRFEMRRSIFLCCTLRSWVHETFIHSRTVSPRLGDNYASKCSFWQFSSHKIYVTMRGKLSEPHFDVWLFSNPGEKVQKARKGMGHLCPIFFLLFITFSPWLETNDTLQCSSDSFPWMVTVILCVENCQNYISIHSCLPIAGRLC